MEHFECPNEVKNTESCRNFQAEGRCREDIHHKFFVNAIYRTAIEKEFRELDENKELTCRQRHNDKHAIEKAPEKPSVEQMRNAVNAARIGGFIVLKTMRENL